MTCRDVMTADPRCCLPDDIVSQAARLMKTEDVGPIPVVSDQHDKKLVGIVTDRDLALKVVGEGRDPNSTRIDEVMSRQVVTCLAEDGYERALVAMSRNQIRRIPVVDRDNVLLGIISQADVARYSEEEELGDVVEDISAPSRFWMPSRLRGRHSYERGDGGSDAASYLMTSAACLGAGAVVMYLMDPNRGKARRAFVRDKARRLYHDTERAAGKVGRDAKNRAAGFAAETKSMFRTESEVDDAKLEARVRSRLGRLVSHPSAIHVQVTGGRVTLDGPILGSEVDHLLRTVISMHGVGEVNNRLEIHETAENVPSLQGGRNRRETSEFMQSN
ncbi:MAG: CBS domain-containing protein, partial [Bryobacteraceae bacterium]